MEKVQDLRKTPTRHPERSEGSPESSTSLHRREILHFVQDDGHSGFS